MKFLDYRGKGSLLESRVKRILALLHKILDNLAMIVISLSCAHCFLFKLEPLYFLLEIAPIPGVISGFLRLVCLAAFGYLNGNNLRLLGISLVVAGQGYILCLHFLSNIKYPRKERFLEEFRKLTMLHSRISPFADITAACLLFVGHSSCLAGNSRLEFDWRKADNFI